MSATVVAQLRSLHGRDLHSPAAQKCAESLRERRHKRTFEVDLSVQAHQELNRCNPRVFGRQVSCFEHIFVRQVFNRMSKNFERMPSLSTDSPIPSQARFALQHPGGRPHPDTDRRCHSSAPSPWYPLSTSFFNFSNLPISPGFESIFSEAEPASCDPSHRCQIRKQRIHSRVRKVTSLTREAVPVRRGRLFKPSVPIIAGSKCEIERGFLALTGSLLEPKLKPAACRSGVSPARPEHYSFRADCK